MTNRLDNIVIVGQGAMGLLWYHHLSQDNISLSTSTDTNINDKVTLLASNQELLSPKELRLLVINLSPMNKITLKIIH